MAFSPTTVVTLIECRFSLDAALGPFSLSNSLAQYYIHPFGNLIKDLSRVSNHSSVILRTADLFSRHLWPSYGDEFKSYSLIYVCRIEN